jgi:hypothetical protein
MCSSAVLSDLPDRDLIERLKQLVSDENHLMVQVLAHLGEVDARRLYLEAACPSMFVYCTDILHYSEASTAKRLHAARAARRFPVVLEMLAAAEIHLAAISLLSPHLTPENHLELLQAARHRSKRKVEELVAARFPQPDVPSRMRRLPTPQAKPAPAPTGADAAPASTPPAPTGADAAPASPPVPTGADAAPASPPVNEPTPAASPPVNEPTPAASPPAVCARPLPTPPLQPRPVVQPIAEERYRVQFTASRALRDKLNEAQDLLGSRVARGDLAAIVEVALDGLIRELRSKKFAETDRPRPPRQVPDRPDPAGRDLAVGGAARSRQIPAHVKRTVAARDEHQCTFVDATGRRCPERSHLHYHHEDPFGRGGETTVANVTLRCAPHDLYAARKDYGDAFIDASIARARAARAAEHAPGHVPPGQVEMSIQAPAARAAEHAPGYVPPAQVEMSIQAGTS